MKLYIIFSLCIALAFGTTEHFPQCKRSDPKIEKCILDGVETMRPRLKDGIPEIKLPALEPFKMDSLDVNSDIPGSTMHAKLTNIKADGASDFTIESLKINLDNTYAADIKLTFPHLAVTADYNTRGSKLLLFNIDGNGKFKGSLNGITVVVKCVASPVVREGVEYLQLDSITTKVKINKGELDVVPDEFSLSGSAAAAFIKSSPSAVLDIFSPVIDTTTALVVKQYINDILAIVPLKDVLTDS